MRQQTVTINHLPPGLNGDEGLIRLSKFGYKKVRNRFMWLLKEQNPDRIEGPIKIIYTRYETHPMDWDNHCASFKIIGDCLERCNIIDDDSPNTIIEFIPRKVRVHKVDERKIEIKITAA